MRILIVKDDVVLANQLCLEIRVYGDTVLGPFADARDALRHVPTADAAILDMRLVGGPPFQIADAMIRRDRPYLFLTGLVRRPLPARFRDDPVLCRPGQAGALVRDLHDRHRGPTHAGPCMTRLVTELLACARLRVPDPAAAERLAEAVMVKAIAKVDRTGPVDDMRLTLTRLLEREHRLHLGEHLN